MGSPPHVMTKAAADEIAEAKRALQTAKVLARSLNVLGRAIEREAARLPESQRGVLLTRLYAALADKLAEGGWSPSP